jgi:16S rRNA (adenine1518-N6/adenine1519-N6)-dimethyltransferase
VGAGGVRDFLARHGLRAHRDRGQNFLHDEALAARLVERAGVGPLDSVIEVGTGLGILTLALAARARRVVTLEVDAGLVRALEAEGSLPGNVELLHADALRADLLGIARACEPPVRLVANLPYSVSAPVLRRLLDLRDVLADWSVMLQREVAGRLLAQPGSRAYGSLGVLHRLLARLDRELDLAPGCFHPVPRVRSTFLRIRPLRPSPLAPGELAWVERVVRAAFSQRRKTLVNALRDGLEDRPEAGALAAALAAAGIDPRARAESLAPETLLALARALAPGAAALAARGPDPTGAPA